VICLRFSAVLLALLGLAPMAYGDDDSPRPNILVVLLDDVGYMDFGIYGSNTRTPTIDRLGRSGVMLTRYYSSPLCGPSRASLMTGQDNHVVGAGTLAEVLTEEMRAQPAFSMTWSDDQQTIATRLKEVGYQTFVTGKWGIGDIGANLPNRFGFDRSWVLDATGASNYRAKPYLPLYKEVKWFEDGERVDLPDDFYSSRSIVDKMIGYLDEADRSRPFFGYLSFMAVHIPVQVPRDYVDKYNGMFDRGWDEMRRERLQKAVDIGLVAEAATLADRADGNRRWADLSDSEKAYWARAMQVNAGMLEAADFHLSRLLDHLSNTGQLDNTLIIVTSDNGPEYNTIGKTSAPPMRAFENLWMSIEGWDVSLDNLGQPGSLAGIGPEWASVSAAPLHLFKFNASEGGMRVPMIVAGPGVKAQGFVDGRAQVADIAPTILSAAGAPFDPGEFYGRDQGPLLRGEARDVYGDDGVFGFEVSGMSALYRGDWKITRITAPYGDGVWRLYDITEDPGETTDLSAAHPDIFREMQVAFAEYAAENNVVDLPADYSARAQLTINALKKSAANYWYLPLGLFIILLALLFGAYRVALMLFQRRA